MNELNQLPTSLPIPIDDGLCDHLLGMPLPDISLLSTGNELVNLSSLKGITVFYCYPMTGRPDIPHPEGWEDIPGARGCTPQSCSFRDHHNELKRLNASVFGVSVQSSDYQKEAKNRLHLPYSLLSDAEYKLANALSLPILTVENMPLLKRVTFIAENGVITKVFYPVFPPDKNIDEVLESLTKSYL
ncbi:peroxiredoxin [Vibrio splendidus]|uniref:peroxiredoxin n=1 Tax=Vibrio splendidus TaxID=29497 RepID=UPI0002FC5CFC|nr:peroxiredoxin [Vibrio splendidus]OEF29154.1 BcpB protein [Vibrio splendidus 1S-124]PTQ16036.1 peroxiredoxin [Vibrio splendidus]